MLKMKNGRGRAWIMLVVLVAVASMFAGCYGRAGVDESDTYASLSRAR